MQKYKKKLFSYELAGFLGYFSPEMVKKKKHDKLVGDGYIHFYKHTMIRTKG